MAPSFIRCLLNHTLHFKSKYESGFREAAPKPQLYPKTGPFPILHGTRTQTQERQLLNLSPNPPVSPTRGGGNQTRTGTSCRRSATTVVMSQPPGHRPHLGTESGSGGEGRGEGGIRTLARLGPAPGSGGRGATGAGAVPAAARRSSDAARARARIGRRRGRRRRKRARKGTATDLGGLSLRGLSIPLPEQIYL